MIAYMPFSVVCVLLLSPIAILIYLASPDDGPKQ